MSKKDKKVQEEALELEEVTLEEDVVAEEATPVEETAEVEAPVEEVAVPQEEVVEAEPINEYDNVEESVVEEEPKKEKKAKAKGGAGFKVLEIILGVLSLPVMLALIVLACFGIASDASGVHSFWPFVGAILAGVLSLVVLLVVLISKRKSNSKSMRTRTIIVCILVFCFTCGLGAIFDIALPDFLCDATSNTMYYEQLTQETGALSADAGSLEREFIRYQLLNGNYQKGKYAYATLKAELATDINEKIDEINAETDKEKAGAKYTKAIAAYKDAEAAGKDGIVGILGTKRSYDYELYQFIYNWYVMPDYDYSFGIIYDSNFGYNMIKRQVVAYLMTEKIKAIHTELCGKGIKGDEEMNKWYMNNYAQFDRDGYQPLDQNTFLTYATSDRMTVPVILRLLLNEHYKTDYYPFTLWNAATGEYTTGSMSWTVLDMNGVSAPIAIELGNVEDLLSGLGFGGGVIQVLANVLADYGDDFDGLLNVQLKYVVASLTDTYDTETGIRNSGTLTVVPELTDDGNLTIVVNSENVERGQLGYMQMTWTESNDLLFAVMSVCASRNFLFIFGAISVALIFLAGLCAEYAKRAQEKAAEKDAEAEEVAA